MEKKRESSIQITQEEQQMEQPTKCRVRIGHIPAIVWGEKTNKVILAVHGSQSHKEDVPIVMLAEVAVGRHYQVLSFDLPQHGERKNEGTPCKVQNCVEELQQIMDYCKANWDEISLFSCSIGTYFSLMAFQNEPLQHAWFLSPLVDMQRMIENMMQWFHISEEELKKQKEIQTPIGEKLYWDYYCYVKENELQQWNPPTDILRGSKDETVDYDTVLTFTSQYHCNLQVIEGAEHYFHTKEELQALTIWLNKCI